MADFSLTAATTDSLTGAADVADTFLLNTPGHLAGTDTLEGGDGGQALDRLVLGSTMTLGAAAFANVRGIERLVFNSSGGSRVTLTDAMVASTDSGSFGVTGGAGNDTLLAGAVLATALRVSGGGGNDRLETGQGADLVAGGSGNDTLLGGAGNDTLSGGAGNDRLYAGSGTDRIDGGAGDDVVVFTGLAFDISDLVVDESGSADALLFDGASPVSMYASLSGRVSGFERLQFGSGADVFAPGVAFADGIDAGVMTVDGGAGDDNLSVAVVNPLTPVSFLLLGGVGADRLIGAGGDDTLDAGEGAGQMSGGAGDDVLVVRAIDLNGALALDGGADDDTLRIVGNDAVAAAQLAGVAGIEIIELDPGGGGIEVPDALLASMSSPSFDLRILGSDEDDNVVLTGLAAGRDVIVLAGGGDDTIVAGAGDDTIHAGMGIDSIELGTGTDSAVFGAGELSAFDTVAADTGVAGDQLQIGLLAGRTLAASAFAGLSGFDSFVFGGAGGGAVRLPSALVSQSGLSSVAVSVASQSGAMLIDGRASSGTWSMSGGAGDDLLLGGSGVNTISGSSGSDTIVGGNGGDVISLTGVDDRDLALITSIYDGTVDINGTLSVASLAEADRVSGLTTEGNYIAVDWAALGLDGGTTWFRNAGQSISLGVANVLTTSEEIAGNAFGSLTAVRNVIGSRITGGSVGVDESMILVIGGADETQFGVYYFQDRDDNATVDVADLLMLLAIGNGDVPSFNSGRGFTLSALEFF